MCFKVTQRPLLVYKRWKTYDIKHVHGPYVLLSPVTGSFMNNGSSPLVGFMSVRSRKRLKEGTVVYGNPTCSSHGGRICVSNPFLSRLLYEIP